MEFVLELKSRNSILFLFGAMNLLLAFILFFLSLGNTVIVAGVNSWYKPIKFALSIGIYCWSMGWYMHYLNAPKSISIVTWTIVLTLLFEIGYITLQASKGELSHFNASSSFHGMMYTLMGVAASLVSFATLWIAFLFFTDATAKLPEHYLWSIRLGMILFFIFSLEGFVMGARLSHTIGGPDSGDGLPFLNWSRKYGDPRIAHFVGMHALQVLPLLAYYLLKNVKMTLAVACLYALIAVYVLVQALQGKPFIK